MLSYPFRDDIPRPLQSLLRIFYLIAHKLHRFFPRISATLCKNQCRQRFETFFDGRRSPGLALRFIGQINIFQFRRIVTIVDPRF